MSETVRILFAAMFLLLGGSYMAWGRWSPAAQVAAPGLRLAARATVVLGVIFAGLAIVHA